jgi:hypothetical protein
MRVALCACGPLAPGAAGLEATVVAVGGAVTRIASPVLLMFCGLMLVDVTLAAAQPFVLRQKILAGDVPGTSEPGTRGGQALSLDGDRLAIAYPSTRGSTGTMGLVRLYERRGDVWEVQTQIAAPPSADGQQFGMAVVLDGDLLAIGAPREDDARGAVYTYERAGEGWTATHRLIADSRAPGDGFGASLDVRSRTIAIGAPHGLEGRGQVSILRYDFQLGRFVLIRTLAGEPVAGRFGASVALGGNSLLVGAPGSGGAAYLFQGRDYGERISGLWCYAPGHAFTRGTLGASVTLGGFYYGVVPLAVCGDPDAMTTTPPVRTAGVLVVRSPGGGGPALVLPETTGDARLGQSVSADPSNEAARFVAGAPGDLDGRGAVHLFTRGASGFSAVARLTGTSPLTGTEFGHAVSFTGRFVAVSAPLEPDGPAADAGAVYLFENMNPDDDGLPSEWEERVGLYPHVDDRSDDPDGDGVTNEQEFYLQTHPFVSNVWHFAEGATGFFRQRIAVANPEPEEASFTVDLRLATGEMTRRSYVIAGHRCLTIDVNDWLGGRASATAIDITTTRGAVVAQRSMFWDDADGRTYGGHTGQPSNATAHRWYFAEGEAGAFDTYLLISNPFSLAGVITARFLRDDGQVVTTSFHLPPTARFTIYANTVDGLAGHAFATQLDSTVPVVAERAMYLAFGERFWEGGHVARGVTALSQYWYMAEGTTVPPFDAFLLFANPRDNPVEVDLEFLLPQESALTHTITLPPNSRSTVRVNDVAGLDATDFGLMVWADMPIVVERAMYWPGPFPAWIEGHAATPINRLSGRWLVPEGQVGGPEGFETYVLIANAEHLDREVTLTWLREDQPPIVTRVFVPARTRVTRSAADAGIASGERVAALVETEWGIVVEYAMYWNAGEQKRGGGTAEAAIPVGR